MDGTGGPRESGLIDDGGPAGGLVLGAILSVAGRAEDETAVVAAGRKTCMPFDWFGINCSIISK